MTKPAGATQHKQQREFAEKALAMFTDCRLTITVPEAAMRLGIGRNQGYAAAACGDIPIIRIGKRMLVPIAAFEAMLAVRTKAQIVAAELERRIRTDEPETIYCTSPSIARNERPPRIASPERSRRLS
jgi:excisionase family DNA binding protein